jgi:PmbA protein
VGAVTGAGNIPKSALIEKTQMKQNSFLLVHRFSGQVDSVTGDFSGVAKGGEWWENGKRKYFVSETLISGNVFDCLTNALFGMSQETEVVESQDESPVVVCDGVSVTSN